eukprot:GHUV01040637.1.p1 GENE.GHUV01040637.1~~GHUV01040637.1.p1  ORF type:complete len:125 (-),score=11.55 GHUV01040637.1:133-507(-)
MVDEIYVNTIKEFGIYDEIWQAFAVFLPIKSVGVQGDQRTHSHVVGLRAVCSSDGMTADWYSFTAEFLRTVSSRICNQVGLLVSTSGCRQHSQGWQHPPVHVPSALLACCMPLTCPLLLVKVAA